MCGMGKSQVRRADVAREAGLRQEALDKPRSHPRPLLVEGGFVSYGIRCFRHKLTLNTLAVCRIDPAEKSQ